jgi:hypothetical protein
MGATGRRESKLIPKIYVDVNLRFYSPLELFSVNEWRLSEIEIP